MKYSDIIRFDPIERVVQLREADTQSQAEQLVKTFIISDRMAKDIFNIAFDHLQFVTPNDNMGLFVVGNYGTGKSHLMSVISGVAERADLAEHLSNAAVVNYASRIAGRFRVIRAEIGATTMSLRDIVCSILESSLSEMGVEYEFPAVADISNNKDALYEMMGEFQKLYPEHGLLFVLDELLDYLRTRKEHELILDLNYLREVGEVCQNTRFRFISGIQESLFDNPRFQFVADSIRRVKDRFEQIRISRQDVSYVVSERLLRKDPKQQARVREHLQHFTPLYGTLNERMDEFVRLFPVHPAYLDTFERVYVAEKREVLKTLSAAIKNLLDQEIPDDAPGLIAYDSYWETLKENPSFRSVPEIREVITKSDVLESRVMQSLNSRPQYKKAAHRLIHALSVHRLTTGDIFSPLGPTVEELRDDLCILLPVPERDADFLKTVIESVVKEIVKAVNGQFISHNSENGQYYLDLRKDIDYDALIQKKSETLDDDVLDYYFFEVLKQVMECSDETYRSGFKIWEHEVEWRERRVGRSGYLFFGAPNERPNTTPSRDFYLYFMEPYDSTPFTDYKKPDEVFFRLKHRDDVFESALRLYAGAKEQEKSSSGTSKRIYGDKANKDYLRVLTSWLKQNMFTAIEITYQGRTQTLAEVTKGKISGATAIRDIINIGASVCLAPHFENQSPEFPKFTVLITRENRKQASQEALRWIAGSIRSKQGTAVMDALELLDGEQIRPLKSRYAKQVIDTLANKDQNHVVNRSEMINDNMGIEYWNRFRLEPEFLAVILAALVYSGDIVLSVPGKNYDATMVDQLATTPVDDLIAFKYITRPKDLPLGALQELFELIGLPKGLIVNPATREEAVQKMHAELAKRTEQVVLASAQLRSGISFWGQSILSDHELSDWERCLGDTQKFLESLQSLNTVPRLKNLTHTSETINAHRKSLSVVQQVKGLVDFIQATEPLISYLRTAEAVMPANHAWVAQIGETRVELIGELASPLLRYENHVRQSVSQRLAVLKTEYKEAYLSFHTQTRLGVNGDQKKAELSKDIRLVQLQKLSAVEMMPVQQLEEFQNKLFSLKTCFTLTMQELETSPICPHCSYRPIVEGAKGTNVNLILDSMDARLEALVSEWTSTLLDNLEDPIVQENMELLTAAEAKDALQRFVSTREFPISLSSTFVQALQEVLSGLDKVVLKNGELQQALIEGGVPCTISELDERFKTYLSSLVKGKDIAKVRIVID